MSAAVSRDIRTAYLQLGFVCVFVLLGALIAAEKLVIKPIEMLSDMAKRFGEGDRSGARRAQPHARRIRGAGACLQRDGRASSASASAS